MVTNQFVVGTSCFALGYFSQWVTLSSDRTGSVQQAAHASSLLPPSSSDNTLNLTALVFTHLRGHARKPVFHADPHKRCKIRCIFNRLSAHVLFFLFFIFYSLIGTTLSWTSECFAQLISCGSRLARSFCSISANYSDWLFDWGAITRSPLRHILLPQSHS